MSNRDLRHQVEKLYNERIDSKLDAIDAAGQWGEKELVPSICEEILGKIDIKKDDTVLEIGCGSGVLGNSIKEKCEKYYGIDISFKMLQKFQEEYDKKGECNLIQCVSDNLPFLNNTFSKILINSVTMYLHGDLFQKTLMEINRVSKKKSVIFIGENIHPSGIYWEYSWFQNLNAVNQIIAKIYIKLRLILARKYPKFAGKWKSHYYVISPKLIKKFFDGKGKVIISNSAAMTVKQKIHGKDWKGNRRMDFTIKLD